jgi:ribonuclease P protein component
MVVHLLVPSLDRAQPGPTTGPLVGFVVSKAVGGSVTRNLVKRRLRHLARERTGALPPHGMLVVRALPAAADASYAELARELDRCLARVDVTVDAAVGVGVPG